jgi:hypothetical protein
VSFPFDPRSFVRNSLLTLLTSCKSNINTFHRSGSSSTSDQRVLSAASFNSPNMISVSFNSSDTMLTSFGYHKIVQVDPSTRNLQTFSDGHGGDTSEPPSAKPRTDSQCISLQCCLWGENIGQRTVSVCRQKFIFAGVARKDLRQSTKRFATNPPWLANPEYWDKARQQD